MIEKLQEAYQKERNELNALAKNYNKKQKEEKISIPGIALSLTLKEREKTLKPNECVELMNELDLEEEQLNEKFKRIPIPNDYKNKVSRAYVKAMTEIITFKSLRKVMESNKRSY